MKQLSPLERIENYRRIFKGPAYLLYEPETDWIVGHWEIGNSYKKANGYHGGLQGNFLKRIDALYPDRQRVLHLFTGMVDTTAFPGDTLDIRPDLGPTYCRNAETCEGMPLHLYDFILADPPYTREDAAKYGTRMPCSRKVMATLAAGVRPATRIAWLDQRKPIYRKREWKLDTIIGITGSTNHILRALFVFTRKAD